ncbi:hypothetical protein AAFC00_007040 [Neodothiora populina]|uniref:UBZ4-type domain-containing protein n=1 Tax=Neodothiora populina TaxID=2781224 RepID=A0ABR3PC02_9PEZI
MPPPSTTQVHPGAHVSIVLKADQRTNRQVSGVVQDVLTRGNHPRGIKVRLSDGRIGRVQGAFPSSSSSSSSAAAAAGGATGRAGQGRVQSTPEEIARDLEIQSRGRGPDRMRGGQGRGGAALSGVNTIPASAASTAAVAASTGREGGRGAGGYRSERLGSRYSDVRLDGHDASGFGSDGATETMDLLAFAKPARIKKGKRKGGVAAAGGGEGACEREERGERVVESAAAAGSGTGSGTATATCPVCGVFEGDEVAVSRHVESHFT